MSESNPNHDGEAAASHAVPAAVPDADPQGSSRGAQGRRRRPTKTTVAVLVVGTGVVFVLGGGGFGLAEWLGSATGLRSCPGTTLTKEKAKSRGLDLIDHTVAADPVLTVAQPPQVFVTSNSGPNGDCALVSQWQALRPVPADARDDVIAAVRVAWTAAGIGNITDTDLSAGGTVLRSVSGTSADEYSVTLAFLADGKTQVSILAPGAKD